MKKNIYIFTTKNMLKKILTEEKKKKSDSFVKERKIIKSFR